MDRQRFQRITARYQQLTIAVLGDFCLERLLEINPLRKETSDETGLPVHHVTRVHAQLGAAGAVLKKLAALGVGRIVPIGFLGEDGEGFELRRILEATAGVAADALLPTPARKTPTRCKPTMVEPGQEPRELNRLDIKNWTATPPEVEARLIDSVRSWGESVDALMVMEQVDTPETGVVTPRVLETVGELAGKRRALRILADSRRSLAGYPKVSLKMNRRELSTLLSEYECRYSVEHVRHAAVRLAAHQGRDVFITMADEGLLAASPGGSVVQAPAFHTASGPTESVASGDAVSAALIASLAAGAMLDEAAEIAAASASIVAQPPCSTGTTMVEQTAELLRAAEDW